MGIICNTPGGREARPPNGAKSFLSLVQDEMIGDHYSVACGIKVTVEKWCHNKWLANKTLKFLLEQNRCIGHLIPSTVYKNYLFLDLLPHVL
jgi:hypothetical protein